MIRSTTFASILALTAALLTASQAAAQTRLSSLTTAGTIRVEGTGAVETAPDLVQVVAGVSSQEADADAALAANNTRVAQVIAAARAFGVAQDQIQTRSFSVYPRYATGGTAIIGYQVQNTVAMVTPDTGRVGELLDALVDAGANQIQSIQFQVSDETAFRDEALARSVLDARRRAEVLAAAAGVELGGVVTIDTVGYGVVAPNAGVDFSAVRGVESVPIEIGPYRISARAVVIYSISR